MRSCSATRLYSLRANPARKLLLSGEMARYGPLEDPMLKLAAGFALIFAAVFIAPLMAVAG